MFQVQKIAVALLALVVLSGCSGNCKKGVVSSTAESSLMADFEKNVGDRVFFDYDSSNLTTHAKDQLHKQAAWLKSHSNVKATIEGHCDERGTREYNLALGEKRAAAVMNFMLQNGIESNRLDTISYGKERPAVVGNDEDAWKQNRRGVTVIK